MSGAKVAPVKWAQRKDYLYITISLPDVKDHSIDLTERKITFSGKSNGQDYKLDLELVRRIVAYVV
jgi:prostaglandin-E synthase